MNQTTPHVLSKNDRPDMPLNSFQIAAAGRCSSLAKSVLYPMSSPILLALLIGSGLFAALLFFVANPVVAAPKATGVGDCRTVSGTTARECAALVALYNNTDGPNWKNRTNWLNFDANAPCNWYGVNCTDGHVSGLLLAANGLSGTIPYTIGHLSNVISLHLENNALVGKVPPAICGPASMVSDGDVRFNALFTRSKRAANCLNRIDPDWRATQTIAPRELVVTEFYTSSLRLSWQPISYTNDGGGYEIYYSDSITGAKTLHGTVDDKNSSTYLATGLAPGVRYYFGVRSYTPAHGEQSNDLHSQPIRTGGVTKATDGNVVVAVYFPADNDLASQIGYVTKRLRRGTSINPNVTVLFLVDGDMENDSQLLHIQEGVVTVTTAVQDEWGTAELDTSDPLVLSWFLKYVRQHYPATKTIVSLMGHGLALAPEIDWPDTAAEDANAEVQTAGRTSDGFPPLPRGWDDMPNDVTNNSYMSTTDVGEALMAATNNGADPFDIVYFDQCFQGNLDALYEVYTAAKVFVASPNYAWLVAAYDKYISGFSPNLTAEEMATHIINPYQGTLNQHHPNAIFWVRGSDIPLIAEAVSKVGDALTLALADGKAGAIGTAVRNSKYVDTTQCGKRNLQLGPPDELIGIETFAQNLWNQFSTIDSYGLEGALQELRIAMNGLHKLARTGEPYIAPDEFWDYTDSLTILTPLPRNAPSGVAWRASIYQPTAPFTATSMLDPTQPVTVTKSLAFTKEGRWDDFLAQWYQGLTPTVGQWCHYIPPELVILADAEPMTLTVALTGVPESAQSLALEWTPADDESAVEYELYINSPERVSWVLSQTVEIADTDAIFPALATGDYGLQIWARNEEQELVGQSNIVTVTVPLIEPPTTEQIFLPYITR